MQDTNKIIAESIKEIKEELGLDPQEVEILERIGEYIVQIVDIVKVPLQIDNTMLKATVDVLKGEIESLKIKNSNLLAMNDDLNKRLREATIEIATLEKTIESLMLVSEAQDNIRDNK